MLQTFLPSRRRDCHTSPRPYQPFQNRTIPLAFRRVSVCVCFICFASLRNFGHTRLRHPCLACPSRCIDPLHFYNLCKRTLITYLARSTLHLILPSPTTIAKGQQPLSPHNLPKSHYPLLCTITLASLVKGRWIDGKAQTVALLHFACDTSTFFIHQTFCRQDGGIAIPPFAQHHILAI